MPLYTLCRSRFGVTDSFDSKHAQTLSLMCLQVPATFDASCIAEADDSSTEKLAQTLAIAIMDHADTLRKQVCSLAHPKFGNDAVSNYCGLNVK